MVAPLLLSGVWTTQKITGWWMSEKYDGVRAYWNGTQLISRNGNPLHAPTWFTTQLPTWCQLDGEIWCGRGMYLEALGACKTERHAAWHRMTYMVFDLPNHKGPFEDRQRQLSEMRFAPIVRVVGHERCTGMAHMRKALQCLFAARGEGLMLRQPGSCYVTGRSDTLLKVRCVNNPELL